MEERAGTGPDAGDESGGFIGEFPAEGAGCSRRAKPARSLERGQDPSARRPLGLTEGGDVRPFLWRSDDGGGERRSLAGGEKKVHRPAHQSGGCVQPKRAEHWKCGKGFWGGQDSMDAHDRSEERRVGKECRSRWSPY